MVSRGIGRVLGVGLVALSLGVAAAETPEQMAERSDGAWLALVDGSKYGESWEQASAVFQSAVTKEKWEKMVDSVRTPLGKVESRKLVSATYTKTLPGAPDGEYVVARFETSFEHKKDAVETVTSVRDKDGSWRLTGYYIK